ncbi:hypothetical protein PHIN3_386 [Sinorhizobium phage phiN3]|uniref:Uncharacterized protein n=1 Tax=Sinorhizobium phage phiN3 TaxID=1647405 RepID=A0A0F6WD46_9CAUD|nr:hypothetical protein AVT40_gp147 [Sinorhizobium phage phiN3]AKF13649.1 hypothetical protein PHIN3_386 [Sinorhizobium phage phiN3]
MKRPFEVSELIRTLDPKVPYKEFERARDVYALEEVVRYIQTLETYVKLERK